MPACASGLLKPCSIAAGATACVKLYCVVSKYIVLCRTLLFVHTTASENFSLARRRRANCRRSPPKACNVAMCSVAARLVLRQGIYIHRLSMNQQRFVDILSWVALIRFVPGLAFIICAVKALIDALVYGHAEFCVGPKYHTICNAVTTAQYSELHWQIQMDWLNLAFGFALLLAAWFMPRRNNDAKRRR